jgi:hypothetical protein
MNFKKERPSKNPKDKTESKIVLIIDRLGDPILFKT